MVQIDHFLLRGSARRTLERRRNPNVHRRGASAAFLWSLDQSNNTQLLFSLQLSLYFGISLRGVLKMLRDDQHSLAGWFYDNQNFIPVAVIGRDTDNALSSPVDCYICREPMTGESLPFLTNIPDFVFEYERAVLVEPTLALIELSESKSELDLGEMRQYARSRPSSRRFFERSKPEASQQRPPCFPTNEYEYTFHTMVGRFCYYLALQLMDQVYTTGQNLLETTK